MGGDGRVSELLGRTPETVRKWCRFDDLEPATTEWIDWFNH